MYKGKRFRIKTTTLGIIAIRNQRIPVAVPANATIEVVSHTHENHMIDVVWEGRTLKMFAQDIVNGEKRSQIQTDRPATAAKGEAFDTRYGH